MPTSRISMFEQPFSTLIMGRKSSAQKRIGRATYSETRSGNWSARLLGISSPSTTCSDVSSTTATPVPSVCDNMVAYFFGQISGKERLKNVLGQERFALEPQHRLATVMPTCVAEM